MEERLQILEKEIALVKERNLRVESDKRWETSTFRVLSITVITYIIVLLVLYSIGAENIFLSALVPAVGFFLSTQSLPAVKRWWINRLSI
jgi:hypothetical protein